jgi:hypothetical protein
MKIISNFKDYYDYVAFQYGIDNSIVYNRQPFKADKDSIKKNYRNTGIFNNIPTFSKWDTASRKIVDAYDRDIFKVRWLIINGRKFLLVSELDVKSLPCPRHSEFKLISEEQYNRMVQHYRKHQYSLLSSSRIETLEYYHGQNDDSFDVLVKLSKELGTPVFEYDGYGFGEYCINGAEIYNKIPNLQELGIGSVYSPEQLYQDLSYFIGNIMKDNPDIKPPVTIEDSYKITGHGFDIKQSFRHRKK